MEAARRRDRERPNEERVPAELLRGLVDGEVEDRRVLSVLAFRVVLVTLILVFLAYQGLTGQVAGFRIKAVFPILTAVYAITALYSLAVSRRSLGSWFHYFQFVIDTFCVILLLSRTGGYVNNPVSVLLIFNILGAGTLLLLRGALTVATFNGVALTVLMVLENRNPELFAGMGFISAPAGQDPALVLASRITAHLLGFYLTAFVAGVLARESSTRGRALAQLKELHGNVVESLDAGVVTLDKKGFVTSANEAAERVFGLPRRQVLGVRLESLMRIPGLSGMESGVISDVNVSSDGIVLESEARRWEGWLDCPDEKRRYLRVASSDLLDAEGNHMGTSLVVDDLSEIQRLKARNRREERLAEVGRLASGIAHEIRNPLTAISGSMQMMRESVGPGDREQKLLSIVLGETARLNRLVDDFLSLSRTPSGVRSELELAGPVEEVVEVLRHDRRFLELEILCDLQEDCRVLAHPDSLRQLLMNLLINAAQSMSGGGAIRLRTVRAESGDRFHRIEVEDEGGGVASEDLERVFDPFFTKREGGTGLGLAVAARIVDDHGGRVWVENTDSGARFVVSLPAA